MPLFMILLTTVKPHPLPIRRRQGAVILRMASLVLSLSPSGEHSKASTKINAALTMFLPIYSGLDARTHNEMQAECHLIVKSLSSSCKHSGSVTASVGSGARGTYFCVYHFDHRQITDHRMGAVAGTHLITWRSESR